MAMVFFSTMRGIPHFYYGSEILMSNKYPTGIRSDFPGGWAGDLVNGFTGVGLSSMQKEAQSFIKKLLNWRKNKKVIHYGKLMQFAPTLPSYNKKTPNPSDYGVYTYFRYNDLETVMVMLNNNKKDSKINLEKFNEILGDNNYAYDPINDVEIELSENISVPANSAVILELISK
jgi:glycosidase